MYFQDMHCSGIDNLYVYIHCSNMTPPTLYNCSHTIQDLEYLSEGLEGRSQNPLSLLFDTLFHPNADIGDDLPSSLSWSYNPTAACSHIVLGKTRPGGSWHTMKPSTITLSLSQWLELPLQSFESWKSSKDNEKEQQPGTTGLGRLRASAGNIAEYYSSYVSQLNLEENFRCGVTVCRVEDLQCQTACRLTEVEIWKRCGNIFNTEDIGICCFEEFNGSGQEEAEEYRWRITSCDKGKQLVVKSKKLVLACGLGQPNRLGVDGEDLPFVIHGVTELQGRLQHISASGKPVVVVGAGISAADAILASLDSGIRVYHVFRQKATSDRLLFNKLPKAYQEYHQVWSLMTSKIKSQLYTPLEQHTVHSFSPDSHCCILNAAGVKTKLQVSSAIVLIGSRANLDFLPPNLRSSIGFHKDKPIDSKTNMVDIDLYSSQSENCKDLYALGPLVGDNFVRFVFGSALGSAQSILRLQPQ